MYETYTKMILLELVKIEEIIGVYSTILFVYSWLF